MLLGVVILESLGQVGVSAGLIQQVKQDTAFLPLYGEGLVLNRPKNVCRILCPHRCMTAFCIGISSFVSTCAKSTQSPKQHRTGRLTSRRNHCLGIKFKEEVSMVCLSPLCLLRPGPSFPSPLCLAVFLIRLLLGRKLSPFLLILLQHRTGGVCFPVGRLFATWQLFIL